MVMLALIRVLLLVLTSPLFAAGATCPSPTIIAIPIVVAPPSSTMNVPVIYTTRGGCTPPGAITCSLASSGLPSVTIVDSTTVSVAASAGVSTGSLTVSCTETNGGSSSVQLIMAIANPTVVSMASVATNQLASDASPLQITPTMLTAASIGPYPKQFFCYHILDKTVGSWIVSNPTSNCDFTQLDIDNKNVMFLPTPLGSIGASKTISVPFTVDNRLGNSLSASMSFVVQAAFAPRSITSPATLVAKTTIPIVLGSRYINTVEPHNISTWDAVWNLPAIPNMGQWEWYCPDNSCGGQGWTLFPSFPANITQGAIVTNAVRWNPLSLPSGSSTTFNITGTIGGVLMTQQLTLSVLDNPDFTTIPPAPYSIGYGYCGDHITLGKSGVTPNLQLPFGPYIANSPIRPLCTSLNVTAGQTTALGDFSITSNCATLVNASGWINLGSDVLFPPGFTPITFTGSISTVGTVLSAIQIVQNVACKTSLRTPQLQGMATNMPFQSRADVGVFAYDKLTGNTVFIGATAWNDNTVNPFRITTTLPGSGIYIFGALNNTVATTLPGSLGTDMQFISTWTSKTFSFGALNVTITSAYDLTINVNTILLLARPSVTIDAAYIIGTTQTNPVTLALTSRTEVGFVWAVYSTSSTAAGGSWLPLSTIVNPDGSIKAYVSASGIYGIVNAGAVASSAVSNSKNMYESTTLIAAIFIGVFALWCN
ncbi:hypothetical protein QVD99_008698 [Batrachochytrium dendrobatidis]|nr:hypothetical protein QVD99_008698 [Batrachochytrium dendrobatidis]